VLGAKIERSVSRMENVYELHNPLTNATIRCTTSYLRDWLARGFTVERIFKNIDRKHLQYILEGGNSYGTKRTSRVI
jgi:hypothetical protein